MEQHAFGMEPQAVQQEHGARLQPNLKNLTANLVLFMLFVRVDLQYLLGVLLGLAQIKQRQRV
jgi:hypothetical protein